MVDKFEEDEIRIFHRQMEKIFNEFMEETKKSMIIPEHFWVPPADVYETYDKLVIVCDVAGVSKNDIKLTYSKNILIIAGMRKEPCIDQKIRLHQMELQFGKFERIIEINIPVNFENAEATYRDGLLIIKIPKILQSETKQIEIKEESNE